MNPVNNVDSNNEINTLNPADMSQQDFISAVYLERSEMLDSEVRRIIGDIDKSNQYIDIVNKMIGKANIAEYDSDYYHDVSWKVQNNQVILDSGYALQVKPDGNGGSSFTITDKNGNQLMYQNQTLIPIPKGTTVDALNVGIPVMNDMTFSLADGTEINLQVDEPATALNQQNFSGGLANISSVIITRGNQGMIIDNFNSATPTINAPTVENVKTTKNTGGVVAEKINIPQVQYQNNRTFWNGSADNYTVIKSSFVPGVISEWTNSLGNMSDVEKDSLFTAIKANGGLNFNYLLTEETTKYGSHTLNYTHKPAAGETLAQFITNAINTSADKLEAYVKTRVSYMTGKISARHSSINTEAITLKINIPAHSYDKFEVQQQKETKTESVTHSKVENYQESRDYSKLQTHNDEFFKGLRQKIFAGMTPEKEEALRRKFMSEGLTLDWSIWDTSDANPSHYKKPFKYHLTPGESIDAFLTRAAQNSSNYVITWIEHDSGEGSHVNFTSVTLGTNISAFTYDTDEDKKTTTTQAPNIHSLDSNNNDGHILFESGGLHSWEFGGKAISNLTETIKTPVVPTKVIKHSLAENYQESTDFGKLQEHSDKFFNQIREQVIAKLSPEQEEATRNKLMTEGLKLNWSVWDTSDVSPSHHQTSSPSYQLAYGESINEFLTRAATASKQFVDSWIKSAEGDGSINITGVTLETNLPDFAPGNSSQSEMNNTVTGYFARKLALQNSLNFEKTGNAPVLNQKEIELLNNILKIPYADASGTGKLTPSEWIALKTSLINSRDHLTSNSQLQTVQLQRAMKTYSHNFEAMSNVQQKIYSLLRDILSNLK